ncbi:hypothetical protein HMPREF9554_01574 [Treponema phagedenis F0421]|nr:hypothetical protein HMPREF9554_01574 [Treponema phagedenis F0421]
MHLFSLQDYDEISISQNPQFLCPLHKNSVCSAKIKKNNRRPE